MSRIVADFPLLWQKLGVLVVNHFENQTDLDRRSPVFAK